jgi:imidazolonepropionase-like amidohydrolase
VTRALRSLARAATCCAGHVIPPTPSPKEPPSETEWLYGAGCIEGPTRFILPDVTVIEPERRRLDHVDLLVADGRVSEVRPASADREDSGVATLRQYAGCFVLPGLIDMHAHLPPDNLFHLGAQFCLLHLAHGVTSVRDAGDIDGTAVSGVRRGIKTGRHDAPRLFCASPFITTGQPRWPNSIVMQSADEAPAIMERLYAEGYHSIKLYENLTTEMIRALVDAAAVHGLKVLGHVPTPIAYETARLPDAQHFFGVPPPESLRRDHVISRLADWGAVTRARMEMIVEATLEHHLANTPTLVVTEKLFELERYAEAVETPEYQLLPRLYRATVWNPECGIPAYRDLRPDDFARLRDAASKKMELTRMLFKAGARLHLGTDVQQPFVIPGASLIEEMKLFARTGIRPESVWRLATRGASEYLGIDDLGDVRAGSLADLAVYERDPTVDLAEMGTLRAIVSRGSLFDKRALDDRLAVERHAHEGIFFDHVVPVLARAELWRTARNFVN